MNFFNTLSWQTEIFYNTMADYAWALGLFIALLIIFKIIKNRLWHRLEKLSKKSVNTFDDKIVDVVKSIKGVFILVLSLWLSSQLLELGSLIPKIVNTLFIFLAFYQGSVILQILVGYWINKQASADSQKQHLFPLLKTVINLLMWSFGLLLALSNLGVDVTSLIAGLGIGGIAVALAAQNILGDVFASLAIYFDKPFEVGDFIIIDPQTMGTVEQVGFKSTRIKSLQGEQIIMNNSDLTSKKIHNYKKMEKRRIVVNFGVVYGTSLEKLKNIPHIIRELTNVLDKVDLDRVHFKSFGDSALIFELVYYVDSADYNEYMDLNQSLNLGIKEKFEAEEIEMAYPTQTVYVVGDKQEK
ncbi:MAG: mechanosensitive ion channel family protein [Candidatus Pacebacteria bacterium]|nr:mechanosensitive ion channel family protein [Candidatus Paceibacterota bacterium]